MLRRTDLGLDDLDDQVFLLAADQAGDTVPAANGALVWVHGGIRADIQGRRKRVWRDTGQDSLRDRPAVLTLTMGGGSVRSLSLMGDGEVTVRKEASVHVHLVGGKSATAQIRIVSTDERRVLTIGRPAGRSQAHSRL